MRRGVPGFVLLCALVLAQGCASTSSDIKQASAELTATLGAVDAAALEFQALYLAEIQRTRADLQDAYVARAVRLRTRALSGELDGPAWEARLREHGLLAVAEEIEATEASARELVRRVAKVELTGEEPADAALGGLFGAQAAELRKAAAGLRAAGLAGQADALEARAARLESERPELLADSRARSYLLGLVELNTMAARTPARLADLRAAVEYLRTVHEVVDGWIQADVTPSGAALGEVFARRASDAGFTAPRLGGGR
ncbi:MAG: hypothetical protein H6744_15110 [Deltaproteobacteria bacterium]|nr:hypothetical protein [Deltaproteobacteria bacterium]MCB9788010.1 hypothetical protein [Deltaproteobacteria bacterium]